MKKQMLLAGLSMALLPSVVATPIFAAEAPAQPKAEIKAEAISEKPAKEADKTPVKPEGKIPEGKAPEFTLPEGKVPEDAAKQKEEFGYAYLQNRNLLDDITAKEDAPFTRAMAAVLLANLEKPQLTKDNKFSDVKGDDVIAQKINWAASKNLIVGYGNGIFAPDKQMTRQELASVLSRYILTYKNFKPASLSGLKTPFVDQHKIAPWALEDAITMCGMDIMSPKDGNFDPQGLLTVADAAKAFGQTHDLLFVPGPETPAATDVKNTQAAGKEEDKEVKKMVEQEDKKAPEVKKEEDKKADAAKEDKKADTAPSKDTKEEVKTPAAK